MDKAQFAILRFAKYKEPEIGNIEEHNERTKEKYASNPDIDVSRSKYNFHLSEPQGKYRSLSGNIRTRAFQERIFKDGMSSRECLPTLKPTKTGFPMCLCLNCPDLDETLLMFSIPYSSCRTSA